MIDKIIISNDIFLEMMDKKHVSLFYESIHEKVSDTDHYRQNLQKKYKKLEDVESRIEDAVKNKRNVDGTPDFFIFYGNKIVGIFEFHPLLDGDHIEVGYWLYEEHRNKGILSKVFPIMIEYARDNFDKPNILATTSIENVPSQKLLEKIKFTKTGKILEFNQLDGTTSKEFEYIYKIIPKLHQDILELETENMVPILEKIGFKHDPQKLLDGLKTPQNIITICRNDILVGLLRYSEIEEKKAKVWSIQIKNPDVNKGQLLSLLKKAYLSFRENNIQSVMSVVQKSNEKSIRFHEKMGFQISKNFEKAIQYEATIEDICKKLKIKGLE